MNRYILAALAALVVCAASVSAAPAPQWPQKKLIEYGWDVPNPDFVRDHIRDMEKRPFNGLMFHTPEYNNAFDTRAWDPAKISTYCDQLKAIRWKKFTDNFLTLYSANNYNMDWFDDAQWDVIQEHMRAVSHMAKVGHCVGIIFDPEPYGPNPWSYTIVGKGHTYAETKAMVRKRGAQFLRALRSELPNLQILSFYGISTFRDIAEMRDDAKRDAIFSSNVRRARWSFIAAFINGWLDGSTPKVGIHDGHEGSYGFQTDEQYYRDYYLIKEGVMPIVAPENRKIYRERVHPSAALYLDQLLALWGTKEKPQLDGLSYADRLLWLEHNTYISLKVSDQYVWCYSERMNWWKDQVPEGAEDAIRRAEEKIDKGEQLGFDIKDVMARWKH